MTTYKPPTYRQSVTSEATELLHYFGRQGLIDNLESFVRRLGNHGRKTLPTFRIDCVVEVLRNELIRHHPCR